MNQPANSHSPKDKNTEGIVSFRRSRIIFSIVILVTCLAVIWPGHSIFSSATPLIFGFPVSFAWIIWWVIIGFLALLGLYLSDSHDDEFDRENN